MQRSTSGSGRGGRLSDRFRDRFSAEQRSAGERLHLRGAVEVTERTPDCVSALTDDGRLHETGMVLEDQRWALACDCELSRTGEACAHQWATLLECESLDLEIADLAAREPPQRVDIETGRGAVDRLERRAAARPDRRSRRWQARLDAVRAESGRLPQDESPAPLRWVVDVEQSEASGGLWLEIENRDGGAVGDADQEILDALPSTGAEPVPKSAHLTEALSRLLLPRLAASGALHLAETGRRSAPLRWDGGEAWSVNLRLHDDAHGGRRLDATLGKDGVQLELSEIVWISASGHFFTARWIGRLESGAATAWLRQLHRHGALDVDPEDEEAVIDAVLAIPDCPRLEAPGVELVEDVDPVPCLQLKRQGSRLEGELRFDYLGTMVGSDDAATWLPTTDPRRRVRRRRDRETERRRELERPEVELHPASGKLSLRAADEPELVRELLSTGWRIEHGRRRVQRSEEIRIKVRSGIDWFDLDGRVRFGGQWMSLGECTRAKDFIPLPDGSLGVLDQESVDWQVLESVAETRPDGSLRLDRHHGPQLDTVLDELPDETLEVDEGWQDYSRRLADFEGVAARTEPAAFHGTLRPYQRTALGWFSFLRDLGLGGCLADDMGLGKTVQILALLAERQGQERPSLVVAPSSLAFQWKREAEKFSPASTLCDWSGPRRQSRRELADRADLVITTYGTLRHDVDFFAEREFDYVVLDEAHAVKNPRSQTARSVRALRSRHRIAVTGTPVENRVAELGALFDFLNPGLLRRFSEGPPPASAEEADDRRRELGRTLRPCVLRRTKEEVLTELPEKREQVLWCTLDGRQRADYEARREHYQRTLLGRADDEGGTASVLEGLLRMRQLACHPGLVDPAQADESCAKFEVLLPMLHELLAGGHKALVFSQFRGFLDLLRRRLDQEGLEYVSLDGTTRDRETPVQQFQHGDVGLFLVTLGAGGTGLHLTAADYVFLLDPWWNPSAERQAVDRCHRMGQTRRVMAYRLLARDTVEEKVRALQDRKQELVDSLLPSDLSDPGGLSRSDLEALLA